jgi:hypothetical protein
MCAKFGSDWLRNVNLYIRFKQTNKQTNTHTHTHTKTKTKKLSATKISKDDET